MGIVVYNMICIFINLYPSKRLVDYGLIEQVKDIFPTIIASLIMGGFVYMCKLLPWNSLFVLVAQIVVGVVGYYILCKLFKLDSLEYVIGYIKSNNLPTKND